MPTNYLFETTDSVIEILWDVVLAFFIVRIAWAYFFLSFSTGTLLSWAICKSQTQLLPASAQHLTTSEMELILIPLQALVGILCARYVVTAYEIPRVAWFRLAIGGLAACLMVGTEVLLGFVLYEEGYGDWIWETDGSVWLAVTGLLGVFALTPTVMMGFEGKDGGDEISTTGTVFVGFGRKGDST